MLIWAAIDLPIRSGCVVVVVVVVVGEAVVDVGASATSTTSGCEVGAIDESAGGAASPSDAQAPATSASKTTNVRRHMSQIVVAAK